MKQQQRQKRLLQQSKQQQQQQRQQKWITLISKVSYFVLGCLLSSIVILNYQALQLQQNHHHHTQQQQNNLREGSSNFLQQGKRRKRFTTNHNHNNNTDDEEVTSGAAEVSSQKLLEEKEESSSSSLQVPFSRLRVLVALVAYDFSQIPHLEEVLDSYSDLSLAVSNVTVIIYTTIPWPVTYIDMMETRFSSPSRGEGGGNFQIQIYVFSPSLRLYLVNEHRHKFYEDIENYDLFIYSEDDILIPPTTIATYYDETLRLSNPTSSGVVIDGKIDPQHTKPSDFNIGLVRYEYQFPPNVLIDDGTRHVTQNVSRIYWEHVKNEPAYEGIQSLSILSSSSSTSTSSSTTTTTKTNSDYVTMKNHHQGCYIATRDLLKAWKLKCEFHIPSNRPGTNSQPAEGTQRVWISSNQLFGKRHCNVQQVLPIEKFGALTIWHLPNKNYRRIGRKGRIGGKQGGPPQDKTTTATATTTATTKQIPTALKWHLEFRQNFPPPKNPQRRMPGIITMEDHVHGPGSNSPLLKRRINEYNDYIERGRILSEEDMKHTELVETS